MNSTVTYPMTVEKTLKAKRIRPIRTVVRDSFGCSVGGSVAERPSKERRNSYKDHTEIRKE